MESTSDFEKLPFLYKTEGKGISLERGLYQNSIYYHAVDKRY